MERTYFLALTLSLVAANSIACRRPPEITNFLQKDLAIVNLKGVEFLNSFKLPCEAAGTNLSWTWKHNDTEITSFGQSSHYSLDEGGTLIGKELSSKHSGTYQCIVKDKDTKIEVFSRKLKVAVTAFGDFIVRGDKNVTVDLGKPYLFQCPKHTAGFGSSYHWVKQNSIHLSRNERRGISPNGTLLIAYLTQEDINETKYNGIKCRIKVGSTYEDSGKLFLVKNNPKQTDPGTPVALSWAAIPAVDELAIEGREKILYCFANGRPTPEITWKKNGQPIVHGQNSYEISPPYFGRRLVITNVNRESHQDVYTCEANNSLGNVTRSINLEVKVPPRWSNSPPPSNISIIIDKNATVECRVVADPEATVLWYKNGAHLQSSSDRIIVDGSKLHFRHVNLTDEGVYQCTVENQYGMIVSATWVNVKAWKPSFDNRQFGPFHLLHGSEGKLHCNPNAEPRPKFQWFVDGVLISDESINSRYRLLSDGTLLIKKVDKDKDAVNYTCDAVNMMGKASATTVPTVLVKPAFVTRPRNQTVLEKGATTFYCNASGRPPPNITWVRDRMTVGFGSTLRFERTRREQAGRYWCHAQNGLNYVINASAFLNVQYVPSPPVNVTIKGCKDWRVELHWIPGSSTAAPITHYLIEQESGEDPAVFDLVYNVSKPDATSKTIIVSKDTSPRFRIKAVNKVGESLPSSPVETTCQGTETGFDVPSPPVNVTIKGCKDWRVELHWVPGSSTAAPITHYLIEQESGEDPAVFDLLHNVSKPDATSKTIIVSKDTSHRFRIRAVNNVGKSLPSSPVNTTCQGTETDFGERQSKVTKIPIYQKAWFLTLLALVAFAVLISAVAMLFISYYKGKGKKYEVGKRERQRGFNDQEKQSEENFEEEEISHLEGNAEKTPLPSCSKVGEDNSSENGQNRKPRRVSNVLSLLEVQFREDGSFTEEYGEDDELYL